MKTNIKAYYLQETLCVVPFGVAFLSWQQLWQSQTFGVKPIQMFSIGRHFFPRKAAVTGQPFYHQFPSVLLFSATSELVLGNFHLSTIWFNTNCRLKQLNMLGAKQMSTSAPSQISSDPQFNVLQPNWTKAFAIFQHSFPRRSWQKELSLKLSWSSSLQLAVWSIKFSLSIFASFIHSFNGKQHSAADNATVLAPFCESHVMSRLFL